MAPTDPGLFSHYDLGDQTNSPVIGSCQGNGHARDDLLYILSAGPLMTRQTLFPSFLTDTAVGRSESFPRKPSRPLFDHIE